MIIDDIDAKEFKVKSIKKGELLKNQPTPFTKSTLQQDASRKLNFALKKTMSVAQTLYEGVQLDSGAQGLITSMRSDSTRLSNVFVSDTLEYIESTYGKQYVGNVKVSKKNDNIQDAHEAIRPTSLFREPTKVKQYLSSDEFKLYSLIYKRTIASLMADAKVNQTTIVLDNNGVGYLIYVSNVLLSILFITGLI